MCVYVRGVGDCTQQSRRPSKSILSVEVYVTGYTV